jgi:bis(5'-nucleosyl)-tetraphosphatase (symmetrical)
MQTYAIGDVQGCFDGLMKLLDKISFNPKNDKLIFLGDIVNRGDKSLETLEFIKKIDAQIVLGNHDYHLLACYFGINNPTKKDTFNDVLQSPNIKNLIDFLLSRDIVICEDNNFFTHAGIPPIFNKNQVLNLSKNIQKLLQESPENFIKKTYGNQSFYDNFDKNSQYQYAINAFMRMRFCKQNGEIEFMHKQNIAPTGFKPWFEFANKLPENSNIYFGHWSSLIKIKNLNSKVNIHPMDTGFVWGESLSCIRLSDNKIFSIK